MNGNSKSSKIRNVLFFGENRHFEAELNELRCLNSYKVVIAETQEQLLRMMESNLIQLIFIDEELEADELADTIKTLKTSDFSSVSMAVLINHESIEFRKKLFEMGITTLIHRIKQEDYLLNGIRKIERELEFKEGLKSMAIAILDDDKLQLMILRDYLEKHGVYNVDFFANPKELLLSPKKYDIYLIDLILPDISGEVVMLEMRKRYENAVVIGISSIEKSSVIANVLSLGANDYIIKPLNEQVFMAKLYSNVRVLMLIKENEVKNRILHDMAIKDGMTGLYNHKHIQETMQAYVRVAQRYKNSLSVAMFDIDHFKEINDKYGHQFGDKVLVRVAQLLCEEARESDIVGRYGGEEFITILPETSLINGIIMAERIRKRIEKEVFGDGIRITISGGVSSFDGESADKLIARADQMLYKSKENGRNRIEFVTEEIA